MPSNILFICGSLNQTTMMHKIARQMGEFNCYFTPFYADGIIGLASKAGLTNFSILGGRHRRATQDYLAEHDLPVDFGGNARDYDLVVTCTDLIIQNNIRGKKIILVQEGMTEEENFLFWLVRYLKFPRFIANTAATGLSNAFDVFCVASPGYRRLFSRKGVDPDRIVVTGIPNFDNVAEYKQNDFPYRNYLLVATSSIRETMKFDDRAAFLQKVKKIANGRKIIFKLHPNENARRAVREIRRYFPEELILQEGNVHTMIANCDMLIAQSSSAIFTALVLGKEVYSYLDQSLLKELLPVQNSGSSSVRIAEVCRQVIFSAQPSFKWDRSMSRRLQRKWETSKVG
jgi:hypothetical protein